jgi:hypothetical protein
MTSHNTHQQQTRQWHKHRKRPSRKIRTELRWSHLHPRMRRLQLPKPTLQAHSLQSRLHLLSRHCHRGIQ